MYMNNIFIKGLENKAFKNTTSQFLLIKKISVLSILRWVDLNLAIQFVELVNTFYILNSTQQIKYFGIFEVNCGQVCSCLSIASENSQCGCFSKNFGISYGLYSMAPQFSDISLLFVVYSLSQ